MTLMSQNREWRKKRWKGLSRTRRVAPSQIIGHAVGEIEPCPTRAKDSQKQYAKAVKSMLGVWGIVNT